MRLELAHLQINADVCPISVCQTSSFSYGQCSLIPFQTSPSIVAGVLSSLALDNQPDYCRLCRASPSKALFLAH